MEKTWRWSGKKDEFTLAMLRQIGVEGIVTALYDIPAGEVWPHEAVAELSDLIKEAGMRWSVVDNLPVSETIMLGGENTDKLIANYVQSLAYLGEAGISTVCYNFTPETYYSSPTNDSASASHIPLKENFKYFLSQLMPVCEEYNINMCIVPNKLACQASEFNHFAGNAEDMEWILKAVDNPYNGMVIHINSLITDVQNNELQFVKEFSSRVNYIHYCDTGILTIGKDKEPSHIESRERLIELIRIFEKEKPFIPFCIDKAANGTQPLQSRMYAFAQIDGIIATIQSENG